MDSVFYCFCLLHYVTAPLTLWFGALGPVSCRVASWTYSALCLKLFTLRHICPKKVMQSCLPKGGFNSFCKNWISMWVVTVKTTGESYGFNPDELKKSYFSWHSEHSFRDVKCLKNHQTEVLTISWMCCVVAGTRESTLELSTFRKWVVQAQVV